MSARAVEALRAELDGLAERHAAERRQVAERQDEERFTLVCDAYHRGDLSIKEAAAALHCSPETVRKRLHKVGTPVRARGKRTLTNTPAQRDTHR